MSKFDPRNNAADAVVAGHAQRPQPRPKHRRTRRLVLALPADGMAISADGMAIHGPITLELPCDGEPVQLPLGVEDAVGPRVADMLRDQFEDAITVQLVAALIRTPID